MRFTPTSLPGAFFVDSDVFPDERGTFERAWVRDDFAAHGLETALIQGSLARNITRGTLRGLHYQAAPFEEVKMVRVIRGAIFDVAVDLRPGSPTFRRWVGTELTAENGRMLYIPRGLAHGYQTLTDGAEVFYFVSASYSPPHQRGVRWNDPAFDIAWPLGAPSAINARDAAFPDFHAAPAPTA
jgi:dTDP-4-dehydrorhamnose 3,5-epimerase